MLNTKPQLWLFKTLLHAACLLPAVWMFYLGAIDSLGADPVKALIHFYGIGAVHCLLATLSVSIISKKLRTPLLMRCRRLLGLYVAFYATLHIVCFLVFEWQLQWADVVDEIIRRPYITVGFVAWLIFVALTLTSLQLAQRRMGVKWGQLHSLVYLSLALALLHFYWSQKSPWNEAIIYALAGAVLLYSKRARLMEWRKLFR
ncbi:protein-methionine-sulfoxide reductase heme-binding subunit MsrQ [Neiella marina]|uniref:Protein-methionine-sulfoxide reductase heme-binding subunit MsrQ n=1 Tax=Neiella marina TaxID=508461 RepID=A0A8J2XMZ3_9GAMM|nr:protein-methionine-sulfoxide reductase heme-binding subunit MsrQ [Neiella marina]GGA67945.1 protein-methionine-sulfoxide reductase heme-binding subunit MsrQ [Neiella marina]